MVASVCARCWTPMRRLPGEGAMSSRLPEDDALPRAWVEAWRGSELEPAQMRRAYHRFLRERRPARGRATVLQIARWVLVGAVLGVGSVYAATGSLRLLREASS